MTNTTKNAITNWIAIVGIIAVAIVMFALGKDDTAVIAAVTGIGALIFGKLGTRAASVFLLAVLIGIVAAGCDSFQRTTLSDNVDTMVNAGAQGRVPTAPLVDEHGNMVLDKNGKPVVPSITVNTPGGLDIYNVDGQGIYGGSSQPKAVLVLPIAGSQPSFIASPSDIDLEQLDITYADGAKDAGGKPIPIKSIKLKNLRATVSTAIASLNDQVQFALDATQGLGKEKRIAQIQNMHEARLLTTDAMNAAIRAVQTGLTGIPILGGGSTTSETNADGSTSSTTNSTDTVSTPTASE